MLDQDRRLPQRAALLEQTCALSDEGVEALRQGSRAVDRLEAGEHALVLLAGDRLEERLAVGEVLEDRALRDAGARGDALGGGAQLAVLEQREERVDERLPRALGADRPAVLRTGGLRAHRLS